MTRPKSSRYTVGSFGPELMAILLKGARERVEIPCPDQRTMKFIQMRLQMLRGAMYREKHSQYELVTRARTTRHWAPDNKDKDCVLIVQPNDSQFTEIFKQAGVEATPHDRDILDDIGAPVADVESPPVEPDVPDDPYSRWRKLV